MPRNAGDEGTSPVVASLSLAASAFVLAGGMYVAQSYFVDDGEDVPDVGLWSDDAHDRILVVQGDDDVAWQRLELRTDRPARATLQGEASLPDGVLSPGGRFVALGETQRPVAGGDAVALCAVAGEGPVEVALRDEATKVTVFERTLHVEACPAGDAAPPSPGPGRGRA